MDFVDHLVRQFGRGRIDGDELRHRLLTVAIDLSPSDAAVSENRMEARLTALLGDVEPHHADDALSDSIITLVSHPTIRLSA